MDVPGPFATPAKLSMSAIEELNQSLPESPIVGTAEDRLDEKGRVKLPTKMQRALGFDPDAGKREPFYLWFSPWRCFVAFPKAVWRKAVAEVLEGPVLHLSTMDRSRRLAGFAEQVDWDNQGRFVIPYRLRQLAEWKEGEEIVLVGCGNRMELWRRSDYEKFGADPTAYLQQHGIQGESVLNGHSGD
jgi:division/cell wall cluster transcriptional repressor MraZ